MEPQLRVSGFLLIASDDRGDQLLYHVTAPEATSQAKRQAQAFLSQVQIYGRLAKIKSLDSVMLSQTAAPRLVPTDFDRDYPKLFDLPLDEIPKKFRPRKNLREKVLDVAINDFRFISYPVSVQPSLGPTNLTFFSIIVVIPDSSPEFWAQWWARVVTVIMRTLQAEQARCSYVSQEFQRLIKLRRMFDKRRRQLQPQDSPPLSAASAAAPASSAISASSGLPPASTGSNTSATGSSGSAAGPPAVSGPASRKTLPAADAVVPPPERPHSAQSGSSHASTVSSAASAAPSSSASAAAASAVDEHLHLQGRALSARHSHTDSQGEPSSSLAAAGRHSRADSVGSIGAPSPSPAELPAAADAPEPVSSGLAADHSDFAGRPGSRRSSSAQISSGGGGVAADVPPQPQPPPPRVSTTQSGHRSSLSAAPALGMNSSSAPAAHPGASAGALVSPPMLGKSEGAPDYRARDCLASTAPPVCISEFLACNSRLAGLLRDMFVSANSPHVLVAHWEIHSWLRLDLSVLRLPPSNSLGSLVHQPQTRGTAMVLSLSAYPPSESPSISPAMLPSAAAGPSSAFLADPPEPPNGVGSPASPANPFPEAEQRLRLSNLVAQINARAPASSGGSPVALELAPSGYLMLEPGAPSPSPAASLSQPAEPRSRLEPWHALLLLCAPAHALQHLRPPGPVSLGHWRAFVRSVDPTISLGRLQQHLDLEFPQVAQMAHHLCSSQLAIVCYPIMPHSVYVCSSGPQPLARFMQGCLRSQARLLRRLRRLDCSPDYRGSPLPLSPFAAESFEWTSSPRTGKALPAADLHNHYLQRLRQVASQTLTAGVCPDAGRLIVRHAPPPAQPYIYSFTGEDSSSAPPAAGSPAPLGGDPRAPRCRLHGAAASVAAESSPRSPASQEEAKGVEGGGANSGGSGGGAATGAGDLAVQQSDDGDECYHCWLGPLGFPDGLDGDCVLDVCELGCPTGLAGTEGPVDCRDESLLGQAFAQQFPGARLSLSLARWSQPAPLRTILDGLPEGDARKRRIDELVWLMQHGLVGQLHHYVHLLAPAWRVIGEEQVRRHPARRPHLETFKRLLPMLDGRFPLAHMILSTGLSAKAIQGALRAFAEVVASSFRTS